MSDQGILLLGGTGFVGQSLLTHWQDCPYPVYVLARREPPYFSCPNVTYYRDSLDNVTVLESLLPRCRWAVHLASDSTPGSSAGQPSFEVGHHLLPTVRFLEVLQRFPDVNLLYLSSGGAVYGNPGMQHVPESAPLWPLSYYGAGKAALEQFIIAFAQQNQRCVIILRPSNFYGPAQPYRPGFGIIATLFQHLLTQQPLPIWGDGETVRDYLYMADFTALCKRILTHPPLPTSIHIYNAGSGQGVTLNQLCQQVETITGRSVSRHYLPARGLDVRHIVLDCQRIYQDYGWLPQVPLEQGLRLTWEWVLQQHKHNNNQSNPIQ